MRLHSQQAEQALVDYLDRLAQHPNGWVAIHLRLSLLAANERTDHQFSLAANAIAELVREFEGCLFRCANADLVLICRGLRTAQVRQIAENLCFLFSDDPLFAAEDGGSGFSRWYDLSAHLPEVSGIARALLADRRRRQQDAALQDQEQGSRPPLDPARLLKLQVALGSLDVTGLIRRQPVCRRRDDGAFEPAFEELYIRIADLERVTMPGIDFLKNRWLFQFLAKSLDERVLSLLSHWSAQMLRGPTSVNLALDTLTSAEFLRLVGTLRADARRQITIEVGAVDVLTDTDRFGFVADFLRECGFRLALDGVDHLTLPHLMAAAFPVDLVKLVWHPALADDDPHGPAAPIRDWIARTPACEVVLCRAESESAIAAGLALGVALFQGRHVDRCLNPDARQLN